MADGLAAWRWHKGLGGGARCYSHGLQHEEKTGKENWPAGHTG
jgi:hypothetical protein